MSAKQTSLIALATAGFQQPVQVRDEYRMIIKPKLDSVKMKKKKEAKKARKRNRG